MKQLLILENGFDLACGLKSAYSDFFLDRFKNLFCADAENVSTVKDLEPYLKKTRTSIISFVNDTKQNLNAFEDNDINTDYYSALVKQNKLKNITTRWDLFFLFAQLCVDKSIDKYKWMDVESLIYDILSIVSNLESSNLKMTYKAKINLGAKEWKGIDLFKKVVFYCSYTGSNSQDEVLNELFKELKLFEAAFATFIQKQIDLNRKDPIKAKYINNAVDLLKQLIRPEQIESESVDVFSFNYSLDERFMSLLPDENITSWTNIHGIADYNEPNAQSAIRRNKGNNSLNTFPAPIFGIDNHDITNSESNPDLRILFTKSYRVIDNGVNEIRTSSGYNNVDLITIHGHSLGRADYSYFETIFDENTLYSSNTRIEYWYYSGSNENEQLVNKQKAITKLYNLLTDYGQTLGETHGANIINKLNIEKRLSVEPVEKLKNR